MRLDGGGFARGRRAKHKNVEIVALDAGAELDGLERPVLADQSADGIELFCGLEAELAGIDHASQLGSLQRLRASRGSRHVSGTLSRRSVLLRTLEKHAITHRYTTPGGTIGASGLQEKIAHGVAARGR